MAALLPLPPKPNLDIEASVPPSDIALHARVYDVEQRRYENARWWRNLNRWMVPVGFLIIAIIVCPSVPFCNHGLHANSPNPDHPGCCGHNSGFLIGQSLLAKLAPSSLVVLTPLTIYPSPLPLLLEPSKKKTIPDSAFSPFTHHLSDTTAMSE